MGFRTPAARLAAVTVVVTVVALYAATTALTSGTFVYPLDDPAIHLSVARRLVHDGTWGVVAGEFQSASSSPLWTLLLAPTQWVAEGAAGELVPLALALAAALVAVRVLGDDLAVLRPGPRRPVDAVAVVAVVVGLAFLPGLAFMGMEHTLHAALVLALAAAVEARWAGGGPRAADRVPVPRWAPVALAAAATATRYETGGVVVALAVGLAVAGLGPWRDPDTPPAPARRRVGAVAALAATAAAVVGGVGAVSLAFGQGLLPNSVVLKSVGDRGDTRRSPAAALERLVGDPLLVAFAVVAVAVLAATAVARRRGRVVPGGAAFPAAVTLVAILVHAELGAVEASLRYQGYLYGLGTWTVLRVLPLLPALAPRLAGLPAGAVVLLLVPAAAHQVEATLSAPREAAITWEQRYQVARFLAEAYREAPIAISELGYISLYHDGPLTDVYGLADHEVLEARLDGRADAAFWRDLTERRDVEVVVTYDFSLGGDVPPEWIRVAEWRSPDAYFEVTRFWAAAPEHTGPLIERLRAYEPELPPGVEVTYNDVAPLVAATRMAEGG